MRKDIQVTVTKTIEVCDKCGTTLAEDNPMIFDYSGATFILKGQGIHEVLPIALCQSCALAVWRDTKNFIYRTISQRNQMETE